MMIASVALALLGGKLFFVDKSYGGRGGVTFGATCLPRLGGHSVSADPTFSSRSKAVVISSRYEEPAVE